MSTNWINLDLLESGEKLNYKSGIKVEISHAILESINSYFVGSLY